MARRYLFSPSNYIVSRSDQYVARPTENVAHFFRALDPKFHSLIFRCQDPLDKETLPGGHKYSFFDMTVPSKERKGCFFDCEGQ